MRYKAFIVGVALAAASAVGAGAQSGDQAFVTKIAGANMGEVELGMLARDKASSKDVKGFADRMISDHRKAGDELKGIAQRKNLTLPTTMPAGASAEKDKLSKLSGAEFDRAYIDAMVNGHREVLGVLKTEAQSGSDSDLKAWASKTTPTVQAHLTHAEHVQGEVSKTGTR